MSILYSFAPENKLHLNRISDEDGLTYYNGYNYEVYRSTINNSTSLPHNFVSGLGLILCKEFISKNNGKLKTESKAGSGSTFSFTLPLSK